MSPHFFFFRMPSNLSSLCAPSLECRARCSRHAEAHQALGQTVGASTGQRECAVHTAILFPRRHQAFFAISIARFLPLVFGVAAPLPPQARALLAAQMVQGGCPFGWACNINRLLYYDPAVNKESEHLYVLNTNPHVHLPHLHCLEGVWTVLPLPPLRLHLLSPLCWSDALGSGQTERTPDCLPATCPLTWSVSFWNSPALACPRSFAGGIVPLRWCPPLPPPWSPLPHHGGQYLLQRFLGLVLPRGHHHSDRGQASLSQQLAASSWGYYQTLQMHLSRWKVPGCSQLRIVGCWGC